MRGVIAILVLIGVNAGCMDEVSAMIVVDCNELIVYNGFDHWNGMMVMNVVFS